MKPDTVPILTSTVVECQKGGFKRHGIQFAMMLMKPEYRELIDPKFKRKIETLVRKSAGTQRKSLAENDTANGDVTDVNYTPCPFCNKDMPDTELTCNACKNPIPFCIATGQHILKEDLTFCPKCDNPAILTHFIRYTRIEVSSTLYLTDIIFLINPRLLESESNCPMCSKQVDLSELAPSTPDDVNAFLNNDISVN